MHERIIGPEYPLNVSNSAVLVEPGAAEIYQSVQLRLNF